MSIFPTNSEAHESRKLVWLCAPWHPSSLLGKHVLNEQMNEWVGGAWSHFYFGDSVEVVWTGVTGWPSCHISKLNNTKPVPSYPAGLLSHFSRVWLSVIPWTVARQAALSMGFSRQEYWSGLQCPPAGDLPDPGIEPASLTSPPLAGEFFTTNATAVKNRKWAKDF